MVNAIRATPAATPDGDAILASAVEPAAFGVIFDRHVDAIFGYLCRRVGRSDAEELASETFVRAFDLRERFSGEDARPWLYGIATNLIRNHRRAERRQLLAYARAASRSVPGNAEEDIEGRMDATAAAPLLSVALQRLDAGDRDVLLLHAWEGLSYKEISDALGIALGTVGSRLSRARRVAREVLQGAGRFREDENHG
jgi:RNA polymerase sigma-70 factor (ECF subfamily)